MTTRTQLDAIIAAHLDPTSIEQFEAADRIAQAAYELALSTLAEKVISRIDEEIQGSDGYISESAVRHLRLVQEEIGQIKSALSHMETS